MALLKPIETQLTRMPSREDIIARDYPENIQHAMEKMRKEVLALIPPSIPTIHFVPDTDVRNYNTQYWPKYKRASAVVGYVFEAYIAQLFQGKKFGGQIPLSTDPDIIIPTIGDPKHNRIYMECKCGNGDALMKILQSSNQAADGPIYYAIGFHTLKEAQKKLNEHGSIAILDIFPLKSLWILPVDAIKRWLISGPRDAKLMKHYPNGEHYISMYESDAENIFQSLQDNCPTSTHGNIHIANLIPNHLAI